MPYFSEEALNELFSLLDQGFEKLDSTERELKAIEHFSIGSTPEAKAVAAALQGIGIDQQLNFIHEARQTMHEVREKLGSATFDDDDAEEVCQVLDRVKAIGRMMRSSAEAYGTHLQRIAETN